MKKALLALLVLSVLVLPALSVHSQMIGDPAQSSLINLPDPV